MFAEKVTDAVENMTRVRPTRADMKAYLATKTKFLNQAQAGCQGYCASCYNACNVSY